MTPTLWAEFEPVLARLAAIEETAVADASHPLAGEGAKAMAAQLRSRLLGLAREFDLFEDLARSVANPEPKREGAA